MYCLYESINEHNAVVTYFVHALAMFWDKNQKNRSKIDDVIILQNLDSKLKNMSITSKIPEISKIPYKKKNVLEFTITHNTDISDQSND